MFKRVLIANRGEIALRIIRALREMNIESVLIYSKADAKSIPVMAATKSICIGEAHAKDSYLDQDKIIDVALKCGCDGIHPGYGFLSENADFAKKCQENGITFIGPSPELIDMMGDKQTARDLMKKSNVPIVPGSDGLVETYEKAKSVAKEIGYPVLIKATAGGGGKGMRECFSEEELKNAYETAKSEAMNSFGNGEVYIEKLILNPKHIEIQIIADKYGNVVHLGERNCSIQRNHQKLVEESPDFTLTEEKRQIMGDTAIRAAKAAGYDSVGTIEFVVDSQQNFYFIEMNTRIQVEHPVTEMLTDVDLIKEQILVADGHKLSLKQEDINLNGYAMELRINAKGCGKVTCLHFPGGLGVRIESALFEGCEISPYYDSLLAKLIIHGKSRLEVIRRARRALEELIVEGVPTNVQEMYMLTYEPEFVLGSYNTSFWNKSEKTIKERTEKWTCSIS
ncbi:MAG: acetyl-CoA carboxylase biotin carboxylase subunit [Pseudobutyrivibrio sp.]|nr:acetyl-CoA carboxylase biotin carboxylase subunit [Pseudobutyrivibrio sp.]